MASRTSLDHGRGDPEKTIFSSSAQDVSSENETTTPEDHTQVGIRQVEAITMVWSRKTLFIACALIWLVYFIMLLQQSCATTLNPFVTSAFQQHSLTPTVLIVSGIIGGVCNLIVAKVLDVFGRVQGYAAALVMATLGLIMMAATRSVEMYAAAQVFWTVGSTSLFYTISILVADLSDLRNRALVNALAASPNMITVWVAAPVAEGFLNGPGWEWCFGALSVIVPFTCLPLLVLLVINYRKAKKLGKIPTAASEAAARPGLPILSSLGYYAREFDAVGLLLLAGGLVMILLPFNLWGLQPQGWASPLIICLIVFGVVSVILFGVWERFFAPINFIPFSLIKDRNMIGAILLCLGLFISYGAWISFFSSFLMVVHDLSVTEANYVSQGYNVLSSIFCILTGLFIRYTGRFKPVTLYVGIPVYILGTGLMIHFRQPDMNVGYLIMCQMFIAASGGILMTTPQLAAMAVSSHQQVAVVMAIVSMFSSIGSSVGATVAGAIWQSVFPVKLAEYLPEEELANLAMIYGDIMTQVSYPVGSPTRIAIQRAYGDAQALMVAVATGVWVVGIVGVAMWRNIDVRTVKTLKGEVF
ncbi:siderophore iron transporter mirB [Plectosphaerella plurivora]|uniref:Siderophore iron transporter mirB n=1 Tax=Plectosphaerella plurivora TaxID=936078 RepID=A0A9P8V712_9PEZI|nr:siderophore iron transporter mirB [Plectosphaerella plurivora]